MADIEKVKAGLRACRTGVQCGGCPYLAECHACHSDTLGEDALAVIENLLTENKLIKETCDGLIKQRDDFAQEIASLKTQLAEALAVRGW